VKKQVILKKNEEKRILGGHQWVFSNEVSTVHGTPGIGDIVELLRNDQKFLGQAFYHPHSLIACRLLTTTQEEISFKFFEQRIQQAFKLRQRLYPDAQSFRLVHGESDFLPGLIIDKYNEFFSLQVLSAGMELWIDTICDVLEFIFHPKAIIARNDVQIRVLEGLTIEKKILRGNAGITILDENGIKFELDILQGQKTGFFLDQRENRRTIQKYVTGCKVLDCFCNEGGFSLFAAKAGAASVKGLDISEPAITKAKVNSRLNNLGAEFESIDTFEALKQYYIEHRHFDVIILDPPSFTKSKKNIQSALRGYQELNTAALRLIQPGGFMASASCSHHISEDSFLYTIEKAALKLNRKIQLVEFAGASADHPVIPAMPETKYLKFAVFAVQ
jgi:23S rRNA (cytosine1962-C5)-methyltransferase